METTVGDVAKKFGPNEDVTIEETWDDEDGREEDDEFRTRIMKINKELCKTPEEKLKERIIEVTARNTQLTARIAQLTASNDQLTARNAQLTALLRRSEQPSCSREGCSRDAKKESRTDGQRICQICWRGEAEAMQTAKIWENHPSHNAL